MQKRNCNVTLIDIFSISRTSFNVECIFAIVKTKIKGDDHHLNVCRFYLSLSLLTSLPHVLFYGDDRYSLCYSS